MLFIVLELSSKSGIIRIVQRTINLNIILQEVIGSRDIVEKLLKSVNDKHVVEECYCINKNKTIYTIYEKT